MAGRILDEDVAKVRERSRIDDIVGEHVALKNAGGGALVGLCPFHEERTPSFRVTPSRGLYYCFGCSEGGDVIAFVQKISNLPFADAVTWLADKAGIELHYTEASGPKVEPGLRMRILEANAAAADFFAQHLMSPQALQGRQFLDARGFSRKDSEHFGIGFAPTSGRALHQHLASKGFSDDELVKAGLIREAGWDFFQGRLVWPIRDSGRSVLGFGARRIFADDRFPAKYLNTPETLVYKKSQVLYGLDLARPNILKKNQVVIVEGYTDVMAAHIAGVDTAVASCGTAFGDEHARLVQRLLRGDVPNSEVIFTFDGDAAGQAAAIKVFQGDHNFSTQTYVAVEPTGLDPCDLRLQHGDAAVRELVGRRIPLYRFVMRNVISRYDLDRADGRMAALRAAAPLASSVRDKALVPEYARELASMLGMEIGTVIAAVKDASRHQNPRGKPATTSAVEVLPEPEAETGVPRPDPRDRRLATERGTLQIVVQHPDCLTEDWNQLQTTDFTHPAYAEIFAACTRAEPVAGAAWTQAIVRELAHPQLQSLVIELSVEPLLREATASYAAEHCVMLRLLTVGRQIAELKSRLQRTNPLEREAEYRDMFSSLLLLEQQRRALQEQAANYDV